MAGQECPCHPGQSLVTELNHRSQTLGFVFPTSDASLFKEINFFVKRKEGMGGELILTMSVICTKILQLFEIGTTLFKLFLNGK